MTKNIRISLYILIPILLWMISGFFVSDTKEIKEVKNDYIALIDAGTKPNLNWLELLTKSLKNKLNLKKLKQKINIKPKYLSKRK